jgi:hypothetical protein
MHLTISSLSNQHSYRNLVFKRVILDPLFPRLKTNRSVTSSAKVQARSTTLT